jgi:hypothetical protein
MSETEPKTPAESDSQLKELVAEVESRFIALEDAMAELRHSIVRLKSHKPVPGSARASAEAMGAWPSPPIAMTSSASGLESTREVMTEVVERVPSAQNDEARREEVRRVADEVRSEMEPKLDEPTVGVAFWPGPKKAEAEEPKKSSFEDYGMDSTSEGSWPIARQPEVKDSVPPHREEASQPLAEASVEGENAVPDRDEPEDDEAHRKEVARIVAEMRDLGDEEEAAEDDENEQKRLDVARMVAEMREHPDSAAGASEVSVEEPPADAEEEDEARRLEVARMVAEMREHPDAAADPPIEETPAEGEDDDEARRLEVARMVAEMRNGASYDDEGEAAGKEVEESKPEEVAGVASVRDESQAEAAATADDSDAQVRDEVRRAVEAARAEMSSGYKSDAESEGGLSRFNFPDWQSTHAEPSGPPVIVIKDPEGRVELARVYETLSRVNCDENAALLNYTPHSVTVGLNAKAAVPQVDDLTAAVEAVFGRKAEVDSDGVRVNVQIGKDLKGRNSAA